MGVEENDDEKGEGGEGKPENGGIIARSPGLAQHITARVTEHE